MSWFRNVPLHYRTFLTALGLGAVVTLLAVFVLQDLPAFTQAEINTYDWQLQHRGKQAPPANIVVVGIDGDAIDTFAHGHYPIPRAELGKAIDFLRRAKARVVGIDLVFLGASSYSQADDASFISAMRNAGNVVIGEEITASSANPNVTSQSIVGPPKNIRHAAAQVGSVDVLRSQDDTVRQTQLMQYDGPRNPAVPALPVMMASVALHQRPESIVHGLPNDMYINYAGPQSLNGGTTALTYYQIADILDSKNLADPALFRNKLVLIVPADLLAHDTLNTPFGEMYGGAIQANALATIMSRQVITPAPIGTNNIILILLGMLSAVAASRFGIFRSAGVIVLLAVGYAGLTIVLFDHYRYWVDLVTPEAELVLVFAAVMALRFATEERLKRRTGKIFGQYVKPEIVEILVNSSDTETALAGARRPISVLFADIRNFTAMSEQMQPESVVQALDIYLEELTESIHSLDGTLDKYIGDELMAIWNAPRYQDDHALLAVRCGLDMVSRMERINSQLADKGLPAISYGVGVNSGDAVVGQMGSSLRKQYDVVGDAVNTSARLCGAARGGEVLIGEETWQLVGSSIMTEQTEPLNLKGKSQKFRTFRVVGLQSNGSHGGTSSSRAAPAPAP